MHRSVELTRPHLPGVVHVVDVEVLFLSVSSDTCLNDNQIMMILSMRDG